MIEIDDIIELQTNSDTEKLSFVTRYLVYENFTFDLTVQPEKFCGASHFCVRRDEIEELCNELSLMYSSLKGSTRLTDNDSDGFIEINISEQGHVNVNEQVGGTHENHFLKFSFMTDQTSIPKFIQDFRDLLKHEYN